jgi:hypothetical protein
MAEAQLFDLTGQAALHPAPVKVCRAESLKLDGMTHEAEYFGGCTVGVMPRPIIARWMGCGAVPGLLLTSHTISSTRHTHNDSLVVRHTAVLRKT